MYILLFSDSIVVVYTILEQVTTLPILPPVELYIIIITESSSYKSYSSAYPTVTLSVCLFLGGPAIVIRLLSTLFTTSIS